MGLPKFGPGDRVLTFATGFFSLRSGTVQRIGTKSDDEEHWYEVEMFDGHYLVVRNESDLKFDVLHQLAREAD